MIGVVRPQPYASGQSNNGKKPAQRYLSTEGYHGARELADLAASGSRSDNQVPSAQSPPTLFAGPQTDARLGSENELASGPQEPRQLSLTVVRSACDVHQVQGLSSSAEVGTVCVAVACQSLGHASREIWETAGIGTAVANTSTCRPDRKAGIWSPWASACALLGLLGARNHTPAPNDRDKGAQEGSEACLVLYCKLAGAIMISPLGGPAFRLRQEHPTVSKEESTAWEPGDEAQQTYWTLPVGGFKALLDLETSLVPGLSTLARDMAKDECLSVDIGDEHASSLAEEIARRLRDGEKMRQQYVVVPRAAGIVFGCSVSAEPHAAARRDQTSKGGNRGTFSVRTSLVLARLEQQEGTTLQHRFILEDLRIGCSDDSEGNRCEKATSGKRQKFTRRRTRVSLPVTYAALLEGATMPCPLEGSSIATRIWRRWHLRGHKYRTGSNRVVPGVSEVAEITGDRRQPPVSAEQLPVPSVIKQATVPNDTGLSIPPPATTARRRSESPGPHVRLTVDEVLSAPFSEVRRWVSTQDVVWATIAAACLQEGGGSPGGASPEEAQRGDNAAAAKGSSGAEARGTACALLARAFGAYTEAEEGNGEGGRQKFGIGRDEASTVLDVWYEGFLSATITSACDGVCGEGEGISFCLREHAPILLLEGMLKIPAVKEGFVARGLTRHLANVLRVALAEMRTGEVGFSHSPHVDHPPGGDVSSARSTDGLQKYESEAFGSHPTTYGGGARPGDIDTNDNASFPSTDFHRKLPWWMLYRRQGLGEDGFPDNAHGCEGTLKQRSGSADGGSTDADGRSCRTALEDIFTPGGVREEGVTNTSQNVDGDGDDNLISPLSLAVARRRESREREGAGEPRVGGNSKNSTAVERFAPPLLRLDALDSTLNMRERASARSCPSHAAVTLSAASTRMTPDYLPPFLSARGATGRASARHGSGQSMRTGRTTHRDSGTSTGCPTVRSTLPYGLRHGDGDDDRDGAVCSCDDRDGDAGIVSGWIVADVAKTRSARDDTVGNGGDRIPPTDGQAQGDKVELAVSAVGDALRPGSVAAAAAVSAGHGRRSGSKGMPSLHLKGLPTNEEKNASEVAVAAVGSTIGGSIPPGETTARVSQRDLTEPTKPLGGGIHPLPLSPDTGRRLSATAPSAFEGSAVAKDYGCWCTSLADIPSALILDLARASAQDLAHVPLPSRPRCKRSSIPNVYGAEIAIATLLVLLLPWTPVEHSPEESLATALGVLSFVGAQSWIDSAVQEGIAAGIAPKVGDDWRDIRHCNIADATREPLPAASWPPELDTVDIALLARAGVAHLELCLSALRSLSQEECPNCGDMGEASSSHQSRVHQACGLGLESVWMTRLLLRSVLVAGAPDGNWRSALSAEAAADTLRFCGRALRMVQLCARGAPWWRFSAITPSSSGEGGGPEESSANRGFTAELLLLITPAAVDLAAVMAALVQQPAAWGDNPVWAARTLGSAAFPSDGDGATIPALAEFLRVLMTVAPEMDGQDRQRVKIGGVRRTDLVLPEAAFALERLLAGGRAVFDRLLLATLQSLTSFLCRAKTLCEMSKDTQRGMPGWVEPATTAAEAATETMWANEGHEEVNEAVSRVVRGTESIFKIGGPVLAILSTQSPSTLLPLDELLGGETKATKQATAPQKSALEGSAISTSCVAATLRLCAAFFSLCKKHRIREEEGKGARLVDFVTPLFAGFRRRWDSLVGGPSCRRLYGGGQPRERRPVVGCAATHEKSTEERARAAGSDGERTEVLLCRLSLEVLVELASTQDPAVHAQLCDACVAAFVSQRVLGIQGCGSGCSGLVDGTDVSSESSKVGSVTATSYGSSSSTRPPPRRRSFGNGTGYISLAPQRREEGSTVPGGCGERDGGMPQQENQTEGAAAGLAANTSTSLSAGDRVDGLVSVKGGRPRWFPGRVERINTDDGTVHVCYDDGDEDPSKDPREIQPSRITRNTGIAQRRLRPGITQRLGGEGEAAAGPAAVIPAAIAERSVGQQRAGADEALRQFRARPHSHVINSEIPAVGNDGSGPAESAREAPPARKDRSFGETEDMRQQQRPQSLEVDTRAPTVLEGKALGPGATVSPSTDSGSAAADCSEEKDDAYFEIPSIFDAATDTVAANNDIIRPFPASHSAAPISAAVPWIDLQSPVFRTRVFSSQLGPGSSLSTPSTGGGRAMDTFQGERGSRSEASLPTAVAAAAAWGSAHTQRPRSLIGRSSWRSDVSRNASVVSDTRAPMMSRGLDREVQQLLQREVGTSSDEGEKDGEEEQEEKQEDIEVGSLRSTAGTPRPMHQHACCATRDGAGDNRGAAGLQATANAMPRGEVKLLGENVTPAFTLARGSGEIRVVQGLAVTLLLSMAATPSNIAAALGWEHDSPSTSAEGSGNGTAKVAQVMAWLMPFFDDDRNADIALSLRAQWRSREASPAESAPAVLAKLVCASLFDAQSYSLDGDHIAAGRFGGIIVSKCPLPLGGRARLHQASSAAQTHTGVSSSEQRQQAPESPSLMSPAAVGCSSGPRRWLAPGHDTDEVALKVVERDGFDSNVGKNVFAEVLALRALSDVPGACHLYDFGVTPKSFVLVIERCACSLRDWRLARGDCNDGDDSDGTSLGAPRSDEEAGIYLLVFRQVVSAVAAMAERGVIHFDLKCENILVRRSSASGRALSLGGCSRGFEAQQHAAPCVCVADFGESIIGWRRRRRVGAARPGEPSPDSSAADNTFYFDVRCARGTERIQSPEMLLLSGGSSGPTTGAPSGPESRGARDETAGRISTASDVWSLGCLLYELLSKQPLFQNFQWSEFFVMLTSDNAAVGPAYSGAGYGAGDAGRAPAVPIPPPPLPPPLSLQPFAALGCAKALQQLLAAMLVRDPALRPSASETVRYVDEALAVVASLISKKTTAEGRVVPKLHAAAAVEAAAAASIGEAGAPADRRDVVQQVPASAHAPDIDAHDDFSWSENRSSGRGDVEMAERGVSQGAESAGTTKRLAAPKVGNLVPIDTPTVPWAPLRPCMAVEAHWALAAERAAISGCGGCVQRLGTGAFMLILNGPVGRASGGRDPGSSMSPRGGNCLPPTQSDWRSSWSQLWPETRVVCDIAECDGFRVEVEGKGATAAQRLSGTSLGEVLPCLGITHVVHVTFDEGGLRNVRCSTMLKEKISHRQPWCESKMSDGPRVLRVLVPAEEDAPAVGEGKSEPDFRLSAPYGMEQLKIDVMEFATGPRVLFVGSGRECGDVAAALALVWAMKRSGKGTFETMLDFRQACAGFWVDLAILKSMIM